jgi:hypothetical protein
MLFTVNKSKQPHPPVCTGLRRGWGWLAQLGVMATVQPGQAVGR